MAKTNLMTGMTPEERSRFMREVSLKRRPWSEEQRRARSEQMKAAWRQIKDEKKNSTEGDRVAESKDEPQEDPAIQNA